MELPVKKVEEFLHTRIPFSKAINVQVTEASDKTLSLSVPRFVNTVTDESFSDACVMSLCELATWTFLQVSLQRLDYKPFTPLSASTFKKVREIDSNSQTIVATCSLPADKEWQQFLRMLSRKARARVTLQSSLSDNLGDTAVLSSEYDARDLDPV